MNLMYGLIDGMVSQAERGMAKMKLSSADTILEKEEKRIFRLIVDDMDLHFVDREDFPFYKACQRAYTEAELSYKNLSKADKIEVDSVFGKDLYIGNITRHFRESVKEEFDVVE